MPAQSGFTILAEAILPPLVDQDLKEGFPKLIWFLPFLGSLMGTIVLPLIVSASG